MSRCCQRRLHANRLGQFGAFALCLVGVALFSGCNLMGPLLLQNPSQTRYLYRDDYRGVVSARESPDDEASYDRDAAEALMRDHFPEGYVIERESDFVSGFKRREATAFYVIRTTGEAERIEHHIHYRRASPSELQDVHDQSDAVAE